MSEQQLILDRGIPEPIIARERSMSAEQIAINATERLIVVEQQVAIAAMQQEDVAMVREFCVPRTQAEFELVTDLDDRKKILEGHLHTVENLIHPGLFINEIAVRTNESLCMAQVAMYRIDLLKIAQVTAKRASLVSDLAIAAEDTRLEALTKEAIKTRNRIFSLTDSLAKTRTIFTDKQRSEFHQDAIVAFRNGIFDSDLGFQAKIIFANQFDELTMPAAEEPVNLLQSPTNVVDEQVKDDYFRSSGDGLSSHGALEDTGVVALPNDDMHARRIAKAATKGRIRISGRKHAA